MGTGPPGLFMVTAKASGGSRAHVVLSIDWPLVAASLAKPWPPDLVMFDLDWQAQTGIRLSIRACADRWGWLRSRAHGCIKRWRTCA